MADYQPHFLTYASSGNNSGRAVLAIENGLVVCGYGQGQNADEDLLLLFVDSVGKEQSRKYCGTTGNDQCWSFVKANDDGYVLAGWTDVNSPGINDILIVKTDIAGNQLWSKTFGGSYNDLSTHIIAVGNGYVVSGILGSSNDENSWILRLDNNGDTLWTFSYGGNNPDGAMSICDNRNGTFGITGYTNSSGNGSTDGYLMNVNDQGAMVGYYPFGTEGYEEPHAIAKTNNGWVISGHAGTTDFHTHNVFLQFINENGSANSFHTYGGHDHDGGESMVVFHDKLFIAGRSASRDPNQDAYLLKIDMRGLLIEENRFGTANEDPGYGLFVDANQVVVTGYSLNLATGRKEILLIRK